LVQKIWSLASKGCQMQLQGKESIFESWWGNSLTLNSF
jgi:hypothetical protein